MHIRFFCLFFLSMFSASSAQTASPADHPLTISELVSIGLSNNPQTRIAWNHAKKMAAALGVAESGYYPSLCIEGYGSHGRRFKFVNGPDVSYTNVGADLVLSLMLCDFGRTQASVNEAFFALQAANWTTDWSLQKVMVKILENAFAVVHAQDTLDAYADTLKDADSVLFASKELNRSGLKAITDVYTGQATMAQVQIEVAQQRAVLEIQKGRLASSLGLSSDTSLALAPLEVIEGVRVENVASLTALAKERRADLMAQRARLAEAWERVKKANAGYSPRLSLYSRGGADHYFHDKANPAHYDITLNLEIPLFNGFETVYKNRYAYAEAALTEEELAQMELDISLEILTHARNLEAAQEMLVYAEENVDNASKAYQGVMEKYKAGKEGIAELSNALRQLATARIRLSDVRTRALVSMANLAYATGTLMPCKESE